MFSKWVCKSHKSLDSFVIKLWLCEEIFSCHSRWKLSRNCPCSPFVPTLKALGLLLADGALTVGGEDFLTRQPGFFTQTAVARKQKVEKWLPRWEMNGLSEGYKPAVDQNWGRMADIGFFGQKPRFSPKKTYTSFPKPCSGHDRKKWAPKNDQLLGYGIFFGGGQIGKL